MGIRRMCHRLDGLIIGEDSGRRWAEARAAEADIRNKEAFVAIAQVAISKLEYHGAPGPVSEEPAQQFENPDARLTADPRPTEGSL